MKTKLTTSIGLALLASGCGTNISAPTPLARVREACGEWLYPAEIDAMISAAEASRSGGWSYGDTIDGSYYGCEDGCGNDPECVFWCFGCATAVIDYAYGR